LPSLLGVEEMKANRGTNRRSFMSKVLGGVAFGALATVSGKARAWQPGYTGITDNDTGHNSDNPGYGRGGRGSRAASPNTGATDNDSSDPVNGGRRGGATGVTDQDTGAGADNAGYGRGRLGQPGVRQGGRVGPGPTDNDSSDRTGEGRGRYSGVSDQDTGSNSDNAGYGRGGRGSRPDPQVPSGRGYTGITDQDSGPNSDNGGYGRGGAGSRPGRSGTPGCTDNDPYPNADPGGEGRHC
jgi:hypothetical protein